MRPLAFLVSGLLLAALAIGQDDTTLAVREAELHKRAVEGLHKTADLLQAEKQHARALELRREIWMEYDENDKLARMRTGFVQVGSLWRKDEGKAVVDRNLKGKASKIRKIDRDFTKLCKELCAAHRALATDYTKAENKERAAFHWQRVLRFQPGDEDAAHALAIREFEGFTGTAEELHVLRRGRAISGAVNWLNRTEFPVEELKDARFELLEAAGLEYQGVRSESITIWGTMPMSELVTIAQDCERAILLAHSLFSVYSGERFVPKQHRNMVFTSSKDQYDAAMEVVKGQFTPERFQFLRDQVDQCFVHHDGENLRLHNISGNVTLARDQAVRGVMQDVCGIKTQGIWEGIGHAACGFLFGQTLTFLLEQQTQRTASSWTPKVLVPDINVWMEIAQESAWAKSDTRTSELVLIHAARFTTEQRVKAWAMCHYLAHWRPHYILELDQSKGTRNSAPDVEAEFQRRTNYPLPKIDVDWRSFWGRSAELREAMTRDPLPNEKAKTRKAIERSRNLVDAVNAQRAAARTGPVGYFLDANTDFLAVRRYEKALTKAQKEQKKRDKQKAKGRKVEDVEMPKMPPPVGRTVLFSQAKDPQQAVLEWMRRPDLRDQLLHPGRELFSVPSDKGSFLLGTALPALVTTRGAPSAWPRNGQADVPGKVRVGDLGARAAAVLGERDFVADDEVGMPFSLHFLRPIRLDILKGVQCSAFDGNRPLQGTLVVYGRRGDADDEEVADGVVAWVPFKPLRSKAQVEVRWTVPSVEMPRGQQFAPVVFVVQ